MRVQPLRDVEIIHETKKHLADDKSDKGRRKYLMFMCGFHLARRVCDMLPMQAGDIHGQSFVRFKESKTKKSIELPIPIHLLEFIRRELRSVPDDAYIFTSHQRNRDGNSRPISYKTAYNYMKEMADEMGLPYNVATHTMRKTFGYHYYRRTKTLPRLWCYSIIILRRTPKSVLELSLMRSRQRYRTSSNRRWLKNIKSVKHINSVLRVW